MTATQAAEIFDKGGNGRNPFGNECHYVFSYEDVRLIKSALVNAERVQGVIDAMIKIQTISAHMASKRSGKLNSIASEALAQFEKGEG